MKIGPMVINQFGKFIVGSDIFSRVIGVVKRLDDTTLTGAEKRAKAVQDFTTIGVEIANWAVNLAIELAVAYVRAQAGEVAVK
jgi:hypothetical protein